MATLLVVALVGIISLLVWQERSGPDGPRPIAEVLGFSEPDSMFDADITEWTPLIRGAIARGDWESLADDLERLARTQPEHYRDQHLDYLHARALIETGEHSDASKLLEPYLAKTSAFRVLALQHAERIAVEEGEDDEASKLRRTLMREFPDSYWRAGAVEREVEAIADDPEELIAFSDQFGETLTKSQRRDLESRVVGALAELGRVDQAIAAGFSMLEASVADDAAEQVWKTLDQPALVERYSAEQLHLLGETAHSHRHFDRAASILRGIESRLPGEADDIRFAIGRAHFWNEEFDQAEDAYRRGAASAKSREMQARFYYHAARAAQLQGQDEEAEALLTRSIAVPGRFGATAASLTQRMRTRLAQKRFDDASDDVQLLRKLFPRSESLVEASIGYAVAAVAAGDHRQALVTLGRIPRASLDAYDRAEVAYWRGRAFETTDSLAALDEYLDVLRSDTTSHYKWFARERLNQPALQEQIDAAIGRRTTPIRAAVDAGRWDEARELQTQVVLMRPSAENLEQLRSIYLEVPAYARILELEPAPLPTLPLSSSRVTRAGAAVEEESGGQRVPDRGEVLIALGLDDEAVDRIPELYPLSPARMALTQSAANREAGATKPSIYAIEVMMNGVPDDYVYELLPLPVRELLYPLYFEELIDEASKEYGADPRLLRSIMREESRFDPRAKSFAAARGLLQFIITTAREIGASIGLNDIESGDLYEPETIIDLGAKYVADLLERFDGNPYRTAAAYNAGPNQSALWSRLASGPGDDYFYAAINFDETRHYVRKVLHTYRRYGEMADRREHGSRGANDESHRTNPSRSDDGDERASRDSHGNSTAAAGSPEERADRARS